MSSSRRIFFYAFGLLIGTSVAIFFLQMKGSSLCYSPNCRVIKMLCSKPLLRSTEVKSMEYSVEELDSWLSEGEICFPCSEPQSNPPRYVVRSNGKELLVLSEEDHTTILSVSYLSP